jgi:hypothetical protein
LLTPVLGVVLVHCWNGLGVQVGDGGLDVGGGLVVVGGGDVEPPGWQGRKGDGVHEGPGWGGGEVFGFGFLLCLGFGRLPT